MRKITVHLIALLLSACGVGIHGTDDQSPPLPDMTSTAPPPRIVSLPQPPYWWWSDPFAETPPPFVQAIVTPTHSFPHGAPLDYKPKFDTTLQQRCLYYWAADSKWRCLPGFCQIAPPMLSNSGFFLWKGWRCPTPVSAAWVAAIANVERNDYLVLFSTTDGAYHVHRAVPLSADEAEVLLVNGAACGPIQVDVGRSLGFYHPGDEVPAETFAEYIPPVQ